MTKLAGIIKHRFVAVLLTVSILSIGVLPVTGCALWCSVAPCSAASPDYVTVTAKSLAAVNTSAKTAMKIMKYEFVPAGKVSPETEAKIAKIYDDYVVAGRTACDLLILNDTVNAAEAFNTAKSLFANLLELLRSVGVLASPSLPVSDAKLLVEFPVTSQLVLEEGK